jgi:hypothetical protein
MLHRRNDHINLAMAATVALMSLQALPAAATGKTRGTQNEPLSCFAALGRSGDPHINCTHQTWMTPQEQADVRRLTRNYVLDAKCTLQVSIPRSDVEAALAASDRVFAAPPQPVSCEIITSGGLMPIAATFAPNVVFKDGFAVSATPGMANVTGVNSYLAWPVVEYVNRSPTIGDEMVRMINAYRTKIGARQAAR